MPNPKCLECLNEITVKAVELSTTDVELRKRLIKEISDYTKEQFDCLKLPDFSTEIFSIIAQKTGTKDPFLQIKIESDDYFVKLIPKIEKSLSNLAQKEKLFKLVLYSIAANMVDFSTGGHSVDLDEIAKNIDNFPKEGLAIDHFNELYDLVLKTDSIIYLSDNCGEVVVDNLVVKFLVNELNKTVYFGLKGAPIANDCTMDDFVRDGLPEYATETFTVSSSFGWNLHQTSDRFNELIKECDLLIVKGQSNFETTLNNLKRFPDFQFPPTFCIMRTKCDVITGNLSVPLGSNIVRKMYPFNLNKDDSFKEIVD
ncbi:MAG: DUF89 family protein [Candidatus Heimdallarchaeota archaeon]|nr:DUF89 family protein [Candidatus Heimdallarchaeota archaeon]MBY8994832.1 DUF89 family protein [Candidatus Heimdallarchaeota archaeon]